MALLLFAASSWVTPTPVASRATGRPTSVALSAADPPAVVNAVANGAHVEVFFADGAAYRFHSLWLRDACRDDEHVAGHAGERYLTATPVGPSGVRAGQLLATSAHVCADGMLQVAWNDESYCSHEMAFDPPRASKFQPAFLRAYAELVAQQLAIGAPSSSAVQDDLAFLTPYSGFPSARAPADDEIRLWRADEFDVPTFNFHELLDHRSDANLRCIQAVLHHGGAIIDGCDEPGEAALRRLADGAFGGLQKDPTRDIANWKIVRKEGATSVSYDHLKRLNQHTDSSIPPHGLPALCLLMHYAGGTGTNTFTDGFAVARQLEREDPEGYALLAKHGYDAERDFVASRVDSPQAYNRGLIVSTQQPMLQLDDEGRLRRIQYNEVFRTPLTLPFDVFPRWYAAFDRFVELVHSPEFERAVPMHAGRFFLMNNWRVLHGRAGGLASSDRVLVGGTITREAIYSQARRLLRERRTGGFADVSQEEELVIRHTARGIERAATAMQPR